MKHSLSNRFGFTLVEMLTVVAIIGILAALMAGAMVSVRARVQKAAISAEIKQLEMALEAYKTTYGEYPPDDGNDSTTVKRHLAKAFPRATNPSFPAFNQGNALVFWLGGPIRDGHPAGFSKNPKNPDLTGSDTTTPRTAPFFEFNPAQLNISGNLATYTSKTGGAPYVYFRAKISGGTTSYGGDYPKIQEDKDAYGVISPYKKGNVWYGEKRFQIISPGLDGKYGVGGDVGNAVRNADAFDNQTNFGDIDELAD